MTFKIVLLPGDGIGPEVTAAAVSVLDAVAARFGHRCQTTTCPIGGAGLRTSGVPLPAETLNACLAADAVLLGAVGDPDFDNIERHLRPEQGLLALRKTLGVYANLRPARTWPSLEDAGPLKASRVAGTDMLFVRELTGGLYFGEPRHIESDGSAALNTLRYSRDEITRVADVAFRMALGRRNLVTSVDKANVLETSQLWRSVTTGVAARYPGVRLEHMYVDACAMALALDPPRFDVVLTENLFGDILSDEAGAIVGSLGLLPSASIGERAGLYEPVHGSAPTLAGKDIANPIGAILSVGMMLRHSFKLVTEADAVDQAVGAVLLAGARTADLVAPSGGSGMSGSRMAQLIAEAVRG
ncbi:MAG: 3-isopropylmalate dehydrogenase [Acidobacteriota bacterium]